MPSAQASETPAGQAADPRHPTGRIVILNGAPRSGKSSIAEALQERAEGIWVNLGVDLSMRATPRAYRPSIGLRPGGERPDLEPVVVSLYLALYDSVAAHARQGIDVVVDVGHHDRYSSPLHILPRVAARLVTLPVWIVGVRCPVGTIMERRDAGHPGRDGAYLTSETDGRVPGAVTRWQESVHEPGIYDLEVDTASMSPEECADAIRRRLGASPPPDAVRLLAARWPHDGQLG